MVSSSSGSGSSGSSQTIESRQEFVLANEQLREARKTLT